jgi:hypothetical protein
VLAARVMQHVRQGEEAEAKDMIVKLKEFLDSLFPDRNCPCRSGCATMRTATILSSR